jgi:hypothetical protein
MGRRGKARQPGKREPNGQLSRKPADRTSRFLDGLERDERDTLAVGIEARVRVHGVDPERSRDQMAGSFVGRLCMTRQISRQQYDAAMTWLEDCENYSAAVHSPRQPGAVDLNRIQGSNGDYENVERTRRAITRMIGDKERGIRGAMQAVQAAQLEVRGQGNLFGALDAILHRDQELQHLVGDLRVGLNALARYYGLIGGTRGQAA